MRPAPNEQALPRPSPAPLPAGRWLPAHHARLSAWLRDAAHQAGPKVAVFDWDNTCIFNDIGDATWRYQLDRLRLHLPPEGMRARLPAEIGGVRRLANGTLLKDLADDIVAAYTELWPHMQGDTVHTVLASAPHRDFRAKMMHLITAMERTPELGAQVSYRAQATFLDGIDDADMAKLVREAWRATRGEAVGSASWQSASQGKAGHVQQSFLTHIAVFEEIVDLIRALRAAEVEVYVVTASCESVVKNLVRHLQLPVAADNIFGMRPGVDAATYPLTYRAGKVRVIREHLPAAPVLVAGDANTDFEMLTAFAETRVRVVINRNMDGDIRTLYEAPNDRKSEVLTLLQGRDENLGCFIPDYRTVPFGHHTPVDI